MNVLVLRDYLYKRKNATKCKIENVTSSEEYLCYIFHQILMVLTHILIKQ